MSPPPADRVQQPAEAASPGGAASTAASKHVDREYAHDPRAWRPGFLEAGSGEVISDLPDHARRNGHVNGIDGAAVPAMDGALIEPAPAAQVLLVHDQTLVRAGLRALLDRAEGVAVVAETASGVEAVALARRHRPQVVVMEAGPEALQTVGQLLAEEHLGVGMLVLTASASDEDVWSVLRAGAPGFLREDADLDELGQAVRAVARGETFLSRSLTRRLIAELVSRPRASRARPERLAALTAREREVMALVAGGLSNEEIARRLVCSPATAKTHVSRAMRKLGARDRAQLVGLAYETGLVKTGDCAGADGRAA